MQVARFLLLLAVVAMVFVAVSCSDDEKSTNPNDLGAGDTLTDTTTDTTGDTTLGDTAGGGDTTSDTTTAAVYHDAEFAAYDSLFDRIAPPEYTGGDAVKIPTTDTTVIDSLWWYGEWSLLGKIFGSEDPFSLHHSIASFKETVYMLGRMLEMDDQYNFRLKVDDTVPELGVRLGDFATMTELTGPTAIPLEMQHLFGASVDLDYMLELDLSSIEPTAPFMQIGFKKEADLERLFFYDYESIEGTGGFYTFVEHTPSDSSLVFAGAAYDIEPDETNGWVYKIDAENTGMFDYRMAWFSDNWGDNIGMATIAAYGAKDTEFAVKYRSFVPADTSVVDSFHIHDQVFTGDYDASPSPFESWDQFVHDSTLFLYEDFPTGVLPSPFSDN